VADPQIPSTVVTKREGTESGIVGTGDGGQMQVIAVPWWQVILIRAGRVFLQSFMAVFTLSASGLVKLTTESGDVFGSIRAAAIGAGATALFTVGQNILELLIKLDQKNPTWRG
jgi:hypothetical protein